jgi:hypothetical protein
MSEQMYRCEKWDKCPKDCPHKKPHDLYDESPEFGEKDPAWACEAECIPIPSPVVLAPSLSQHQENDNTAIHDDDGGRNSNCPDCAKEAATIAEINKQMEAEVDQPGRKVWETTTVDQLLNAIEGYSANGFDRAVAKTLIEGDRKDRVHAFWAYAKEQGVVRHKLHTRWVNDEPIRYGGPPLKRHQEDITGNCPACAIERLLKEGR